MGEGQAGVRVVNDGTTSNDDRLGAIGDIAFVIDELGVDDDLVVVAGDNLFGDDISGFGAYGQEVDAPVLAIHDVGDLALMREYNQVETDDEGRVDLHGGEAGERADDACRDRALLLPAPRRSR